MKTSKETFLMQLDQLLARAKSLGRDGEASVARLEVLRQAIKDS